MNTRLDNTVLLPLTTAIIGLALGRLLFGNSTESSGAHKLHSSLETEKQTANHHHSQTSIAKPFAKAKAMSDVSEEVVNEREAEFHRAMTEDDWNKTRELDQRAREGEYVLQFERPVAKRRAELAINRFAADAARQNAAQYSDEFAKLGMAPSTANQLMTHVEKINKAAMEAELSLQQLLSARKDYEERLHSTMPEEAFSQYKNFEESKAATREYQNLQAYLKEKNLAIDPAYEAGITKLMQEAQAYTQKSWRGPFEGVPEPGVGKTMVISQMEQSISEITERANTLVQKVPDAGLPESYGNLLADYYNAKILEKQQVIASVKNPSEECNPPLAKP